MSVRLLPQDLLDKLACPKCRGVLELQENGTPGLACATCDLLYAIADGIPVLIVELASPLSARER